MMNDHNHSDSSRREMTDVELDAVLAEVDAGLVAKLADVLDVDSGLAYVIASPGIGGARFSAGGRGGAADAAAYDAGLVRRPVRAAPPAEDRGVADQLARLDARLNRARDAFAALDRRYTGQEVADAAGSKMLNAHEYVRHLSRGLEERSLPREDAEGLLGRIQESVNEAIQTLKRGAHRERAGFFSATLAGRRRWRWIATLMLVVMAGMSWVGSGASWLRTSIAVIVITAVSNGSLSAVEYRRRQRRKDVVMVVSTQLRSCVEMTMCLVPDVMRLFDDAEDHAIRPGPVT